MLPTLVWFTDKGSRPACHVAGARAWHLVDVCVKRDNVRGDNSAGHEGRREVQEWEGGERKNEGTGGG